MGASGSRVGAELVVLGTASRHGLTGHRIGHTPERLFGRLHCSLLAVKPDEMPVPL